MYGRGLHDKGLTMYQAFAYVYDEMDIFLHKKDDKIRVGAFTALFVLAIEGGVNFIKDDSFTQDVFDELAAAYSKLPSLGLTNGSAEEEELLLHVRLVASHTGIAGI